MPEPTKPQDPKKKPPQPILRSLIVYATLVMFMVWLWQSAVGSLGSNQIDYSVFKKHLKAGEVTEAVVEPDSVRGRIEPGIGKVGKKSQSFLFRTPRMETDDEITRQLEEAGVPKYTGERPSFLTQLFFTGLLPLLLLFGLMMLLARRSPGQSMLSFGRSKAKMSADSDTGVSFADVAGCDEAKQELQEVVDFLKNPDRYRELGAKIPKGVLLVGPPGTGKTLLARAVAGEAKVPFFSLAGSDFVEMFVGVGASRVRDLFQQAVAKAPCIIFIDELDAIGRARGVHIGAVNDEREQTLNQLLVEMDGFEANKGVIMLAATNRPDVLDKALLRPGRFDRQVVVDAPDIDGRVAILQVHVRNKPLAPEVDLRRVAQGTPGFSGADLANAVNEAALLAARKSQKQITQKDLEEAVEKVVAGPERKSRRLDPLEKKRVAFHEVGHALVAAYSSTADPVHKISVVPRGRAALGYTLQIPLEEQYLHTRGMLLDKIRGLLGGRAAEEVVFNEVSTGAANDLERATDLARQMVSIFGMSETLGLAHCGRKDAFFVEQGMQLDCSNETAHAIEQEVRRILEQCYADAKDILVAHRDELELVAQELLKSESLDGETFKRLIGKPTTDRAVEPART